MDQDDDWHIEGEAGPPPASLDEKPCLADAESERQRQREARNDKRRRLEVTFAGAIALFALVQACVSYWQWDAMDRQLHVARDQLHLGVRPQLVILDVNRVTLEPNVVTEASVAIANVGAGPALNVHSDMQWLVSSEDSFEEALDASTVVANPDSGREQGYAIIGNRDDASVLSSRPLGPWSADIVERLKSGSLNLWLWGSVNYECALGDRHSLGFCELWNPKEGNWSIGGTCNWTK